MKIFKLNDTYSIVCNDKKTRSGFKHEATLRANGLSQRSTKICYLNRTWESYEYQSVVHRLIDLYFSKDQAQRYKNVVDGKGNEESKHAFDTVKLAMVVGELVGGNKEERVAFKKRMLSTVPGMEFPDGFDELPVEERERRLKAVENTL